MKKLTTMVYIIRDNKILFLVRNKENDTMHSQGVYISIGGHVEDGEGIIEAAKREVLEEASISVEDITLRAVLYFRNFGLQKNDLISYLFTTSSFSGVPKDGCEGHFEWVAFEDFGKIDLYEGDRIYLQYLQKYSFFTAEFVYNGHTYLSHTLLNSIHV